ncbi:MAG: SsrA-binding protein SmpB [bacterium]
MAKKKKLLPGTIAVNKKARHEFSLGEKFEAGLALLGWEVKSLRQGRIQLNESHIIIRKGEAWLYGSLITPLQSASTHIVADPLRERKLLLHKKELSKLIGAVERKGFALIPTAMYWKSGKIKLEFYLAQGKKQHDKRQAEKQRDWNIQKQRYLRRG